MRDECGEQKEATMRRNVRFLFGSVLCGYLALTLGCAATGSSGGGRLLNASYNSALVQIDRPEATKEQYGAVVTIKPEAGNKYTYEDGLFSGIFFVATSRINFTISNKTEHSIKIVWDDAAFIEISGQSARLAHEGVKYADSNASQPPSVIPARQSLTDFVLPTNRVYYRKGYYGTYYSSPGGWEELPLVLPASHHVESSDTSALATFTSDVEKNKGKRFGILLPLEIEGVVNEYTFWFEVQTATVAP
jgi:hypothetical protein